VWERPDLVERLVDRFAVLRIGDLALVDAEDERRVGTGEGRAVRLEEIERLLGLGARDREVVGRLTTGPGRPCSSPSSPSRT
jgi:hypothetical protein